MESADELCDEVVRLIAKYQTYASTSEGNMRDANGIIDRRAEAFRDAYEDVVDDLALIIRPYHSCTCATCKLLEPQK